MIFAIVHFNTPMLTTCLLSSLKRVHPDATIVVFDNSDAYPLFKNVIKYFDIRYYDNTTGDILNFDEEIALCGLSIDPVFYEINKLASIKHTLTIDWLLSYLPYNEIVLLDSDILFHKPINFIDHNKITIGQLSEDEVNTRPERKFRILPYCQYFNIELLRKYKMRYFDSHRIIGFNTTQKQGRWAYDTGASFFEDVIDQYPNLCDSSIKLNDYIVHYKGGSWATNSKPIPYETWLGNYAKLWASSK